jgi:hypothetical protein
MASGSDQHRRIDSNHFVFELLGRDNVPSDAFDAFVILTTDTHRIGAVCTVLAPPAAARLARETADENDLPAQNLCSGPKSTIKDLAESVYLK